MGEQKNGGASEDAPDKSLLLSGYRIRRAERFDQPSSSSGIPAREVSREATAASAAVPRTVPQPTSVIIAEAGSMATAVWQNVLAARMPAALIQVVQLRINIPPYLVTTLGHLVGFPAYTTADGMWLSPPHNSIVDGMVLPPHLSFWKHCTLL